jgi:alpha-galactosidase
MGSVLLTSDNFFDYTEEETKELSKILKRSDADIISADLDDYTLTLRFMICENKYIKRYDM